MLNSKRAVGKSRRYRSSVGVVPARARSASRFRSATPIPAETAAHQTGSSWRAKFFAIFALILMLGGVYEFFIEDWFFVYQFDIQGANYLTSSEIERASRMSGYNVFFIEPSAVERVLKQMPEIKSVHVATGLPNIMLIQVEERAPKAVWLKGDQAFWVDSDGYAFKERVQNADLPTVRDLDSTELKAGKRVHPAAMNAVQALLTAWSDAPRNLEWSTTSGLSMTDEHGWKILFGDAKDMDFKVAKLQALVPTLVSQGTRIRMIDLGKGDPYYQ